MTERTISLDAHLSRLQLELTQLCGLVAEQLGSEAYIIGGSVRDMLLGLAVRDLDIVFAKDAGTAKDLLARNHAATVLKVSKFDTFLMRYRGLVFDLVQARGETYPTDGALPKVQRGTIMDDLYRRDFTVNALAVSISRDSFGQLSDPFGGLADLQSRTIRTLHSASFANDPTRMVRAVRYSVRLGFKLADSTAAELYASRAALRTISNARLTNEIIKVLQEPRRAEILLRMAQLGLTEFICPGLSEADSNLKKLKLRDEKHSSGDKLDIDVGFAYWVASLERVNSQSLADRLQLSRAWSSIVSSQQLFADSKQLLTESGLSPSAVTKILKPLDETFLSVCADVTESNAVAEYINMYLTKYRFAKPKLGGSDLLKLGFSKNLQLGRCLQQLTDAVLDGELKTKSDELQYAQQLLTETKAQS